MKRSYADVAEGTEIDLPVPGKPGGIQNSLPGLRMRTGCVSSNVLLARSVAGFAGNAGHQAGSVVMIIKCARPGCMDEAGVAFHATGSNGPSKIRYAVLIAGAVHPTRTAFQPV